MATWYTYSVPYYEKELETLENEFETEYKEEQEKLRRLAEFEIMLFDEKIQFYEDLSKVPHFLKFYYHVPSLYIEDSWCTPDFECMDPMGLFYKYLDKKTFRTLRKKIFKMKKCKYKAEGKQQLTKSELYILLSFARRWCKINLLYHENDRDFNYKITLWVASRILFYLEC